jgi:hypothetical protein
MQFGSDYSSVSSLHSFLTAAKDLKGSSADSVKLIADYLGLMLKGACKVSLRRGRFCCILLNKLAIECLHRLWMLEKFVIVNVRD